jgi:hypothetical protein
LRIGFEKHKESLGGVQMRVNILLSSRDMDIIRIFTTMRPSDVVRNVVRAHLSGQACSLTALPTTTDNFTSGLYHFRLNEVTDRDVIVWLKSIRHGQMSNVLKILIRHALLPDLDLFTDGAETLLIPSSHADNQSIIAEDVSEPQSDIDEASSPITSIPVASKYSADIMPPPLSII